MPDLFNVLRTIHLNYGGEDSLKKIAVYDSDTPMTLKQDQGHKTWYKLVDPKQGYNNAQFEKTLLEQCL